MRRWVAGLALVGCLVTSCSRQPPAVSPPGPTAGPPTSGSTLPQSTLRSAPGTGTRTSTHGPAPSSHVPVSRPLVSRSASCPGGNDTAASPGWSWMPGDGYPPDPNDPHLAQTIQVLEGLFDRVRLPGDAIAAACPPTADLGQMPEITASPGFLVDRAQWWTSARSPAEVLAYVAQHPPTGTIRAAAGQITGLQFAGYDLTTDPPTSSGTQILVTVTPLGSGSGIRIDADAIWIPTKTAAETVPLNVNSVDVTQLHRPTPIHKTLRGAAARSIATALNRLIPSPPAFNAGGPVDGDPRPVDNLVFHTPHRHDIHVTVTVEEFIAAVYVTVAGKPQPILAGYNGRGPRPRTLDDAITTALKPPR